MNPHVEEMVRYLTGNGGVVDYRVKNAMFAAVASGAEEEAKEVIRRMETTTVIDEWLSSGEARASLGSDAH